MLPVDFSDQKVRDDLLAFVPERYRRQCILFAGGSLVEGFGNSTSDIDIIAVVGEEPDGSLSAGVSFSTIVTPGMEIHLGTYNGIRVDLEVVSDRIFTTVGQALLSGTGASAVPNFLRPTLNNLKIGVPLQHDERFVQLREGFPWLAYGEALVHEAAGRFNGPSVDAVGAIDAADVGAAINTSRYAMESASEAFLASLGNTNLRAKWRLRMFDRYASAETAKAYAESLLEDSLDPHRACENAQRRLRTAQVLLMQAHENVQSARRGLEDRLRRPRREVEFDGFTNARDMGGLPAGFAGLRYGIVFRAGRTSAAQPQALIAHGVQQVIDLRNEDERASVAPVDVPGVTTLSLPQPTFDAGQTVKALEAIASASGATLVHCAMGRDRTSLLVSSILAALGASRRVIVDEYMHAVRGWDHATGRIDRSEEMYMRVAREFELTMSSSDLLGQLTAAGLAASTIELLRSRLLTKAGEEPDLGKVIPEENGELNVQTC